MASLKKLILATGITLTLIGCPDKPKIYEEIKTENVVLIHAGNGYFLKGNEFDFEIDEKYAKKINENNSAVAKYKIIYEYIKNGSIDKYGNKINVRIIKNHKLIDVYPKEDKNDYN